MAYLLPRATCQALGVALGLVLSLTACDRAPQSPELRQSALYPGETAEMRVLIVKYSAIHQIPESLLHRVIQRESGYNPSTRNGPYYGLMQIQPQTAGTMGYSGPASGLLDAETNLIYAGRYLRGAWLVSGGDEAAAVTWYAKGYYYEAKRLGLLVETGLRG
jgi:soluble lytic murein transglycosylase-like protein